MKKIIYLFGLLVLASSCNKDDDNSTETPDPPVTTSSNPYFSGSLNGSSWSYTFPTSQNGMGYSAGWNYENDQLSLDYFSSYEELGPDFEPVNGIMSAGYSGFEYQLSTYDAAAFQSSMAAAPQTYYVDNGSNAGFEISFMENDGTFWSTRFGSQSGSSLMITTNEEAPSYMNQAARRFKGAATCKLYNSENPSEFKTITNASFHFLLYEYDM
jgi:hypothetical protein